MSVSTTLFITRTSNCPSHVPFFYSPETPFREGQERDLKAALKGTDPSIPLVFVSGNHDLGNTPTPGTVEQYCSAWGDDYFSFWVSKHLDLVGIVYVIYMKVFDIFCFILCPCSC